MDFANDRGGFVKLSRNQDVIVTIPIRDIHLRMGFITLEKLEHT